MTLAHLPIQILHKIIFLSHNSACYEVSKQFYFLSLTISPFTSNIEQNLANPRLVKNTKSLALWLKYHNFENDNIHESKILDFTIHMLCCADRKTYIKFSRVPIFRRCLRDIMFILSKPGNICFNPEYLRNSIQLGFRDLEDVPKDMIVWCGPPNDIANDIDLIVTQTSVKDSKHIMRTWIAAKGDNVTTILNLTD